VSRKWKNWYPNEVDEETKGADSRDTVKHDETSDQLFLESKMKVAEQAYDTARGAIVLRGGRSSAIRALRPITRHTWTCVIQVGR